MLRIAFDHDCEELLGNKLLAIIDNNRPLPSLKALQERYLGKQHIPAIPERQHALTGYDYLLQGHWYQSEAGHA